MQENEIDVTNVQEKGLVRKIKDWSYENWQTILIILIVLIVGVSAYNYNQQGENTADNSKVALLDNESEDNIEDNNSNEKDVSDEQNESSIESSIESNIVSNDQEAEIENTDEKKAESEDNKTKPASDKNEELKNNNEKKEKEKETVISSDSSTSGKTYTVTAKSGDGITHLARHALEKYLEDINGGSNLTKEHRIYIEDFLQNKIGNQKLEIGDQETFSENLIQEAISNARNLSPKSLENLSRYTKNIK